MNEDEMPSLDDIPLAEKIELLRKNIKPGQGAPTSVSSQKGGGDDVPISHRLALLKKRLERPDDNNTSKNKTKAEKQNDKHPTKAVREDIAKIDAQKKARLASSRELELKGSKKTAVEARTLAERTEARASKQKHREEAHKVKKEKIDDDQPKIKREKKSKETLDSNMESQEEEEYKWWEESMGDKSVKWKTLEHNGPLFPPLYEPHGVPLLYNGQYMHLEPEAEEVAGFFAALLGTEHAENPVFQQNFFDDFRQVLRECHSKWRDMIKEFDKCDFTSMHRHFEAIKEQKKAMTKEEKLKLKDVKTGQEKEFGFALLDGRREKIGNFRIEPPGLFRGRGKHPKTGRLKRRVQPEQVTINVGAECKIPSPPAGHSWGKVIHDNTVTWLATWVENINGAQKYVFLAPGSSLKGQSDLKKFETARKLKEFVDEIRRVNAAELHDKEMFVRQRATALWLIDHLALRAGNEKGDDEADTVGCCSLRLEHIKLVEPSTVIFDFLGKDSIRYYNEVRVEPIIFKNLSIFMRQPKIASDPIFDRLTTSTLNKYLNGLMDGLTAKVFRTFNASHTFQIELEKTPQDEASVAERILAYNRANREVAILCNHQRSVPKTHGQSMEKLKEKILTLKYQRYLLRKQMKNAMDKKELKGKCPRAIESESDMDDEVIERKKKEEENLRIEKYRKSHPDDPNGVPPPSSPQKSTSSDTLIKRFESITARIHAARHLLIDKDENKTTALGTSKTNYIDPRITVAWCSRHNVPIEKMFTKTLREKFKWAMSAEMDWAF